MIAFLACFVPAVYELFTISLFFTPVAFIFILALIMSIYRAFK